MLTFPHIEHLNDLLSHIKNRPEIKVMKQENGTQVVCYIVATDETFNNEWTRECRGITFDADGKIICRPLHKFFNVNERESTQIDKLNWNDVFRITDKRDGSMISTCYVNGKIVVKTKKSFTSDVAVAAQKWFDAHPNYVEFAELLADGGMTPTFEYTSPSNRIVLPYEEDEMTLLHVRDNFTGFYPIMRPNVLKDFGIKTVDEIPVTNVQEFLADAKNVKGVEGWVIQFNDGDMVKLKTEEYLISHRLITFVRERDVAEMVLNENLDDVKSAMLERGISLDKIHKVEHRVIEILRELETEVEEVYEQNKSLPERKDFALVAMKYKTFGLIMQRYSGKEPDYVRYFKTHKLNQEFGLTTVN